MNNKEIEKYIISENANIVDAMEKIDLNAKGIIFVVNSFSQLIGSVTDGDIRRWLMRTGDLSSKIINVMQKEPVTIFSKERELALETMKLRDVRAVPVLNENNCVLDIVMRDEMKEERFERSNGVLCGVSVIIMAGGMGTRLYPFTKILPKPLIPIGDTPIIERIINEFCKFNVNDFYVSVNYRKEMIRSYFSEINHNYVINFVEEEKPLGTGGSIRLVQNILDKSFFVINSDALIFADYNNIYKYHNESGNDITIVSALKNTTIPYGVLHLGEGGELQFMEEKPKLSHFINTGMYVVSPNVIDYIPKGKMFHMTQLVEAIMNKAGKVGVYPISEDSFLDMGEFSEMKRMEEKLHII